MKFSTVMNGVRMLKRFEADAEVTGLCCKIESLQPGQLFCCITGGNRDRHDDVAEAERRGAAAIIAEREVQTSLPVALVKNARKAMALAAKNFYGRAIDRMKLIAVTGTNGKTTVCHLIEGALRAAGYRTGLIGTCGCFAGGDRFDTGMTTPDPIELHALFAEFERRGVEYVVMEVSAHAVYWNKMAGTVAEAAVFTNLTQDHLDFFGTMARYKRAKLAYFTPEYVKAAVVNIDDEAGREIAASGKIPVVTYGRARADAVFSEYVSSYDGVRFTAELFGERAEFRYAAPGKFNAYNTLAAACCARLLGVELTTVQAGIAALPPVSGRFNLTRLASGATAVVDYAHTPDGLKNLLSAAREITERKLICVFGCGGDRDRKKRPLMGKAVSEGADMAVITSDNPRGERPGDIIADVEKGMDKSGYYLAIENRAEAIRFALESAGEGDVVLIAGKGHEQYQEIAGVKHPFSDAQAVAAYAK